MHNEELDRENNAEFDPTLAKALLRVDAPGSLEMRLMAAAENLLPRKAKVLAFPKPQAWVRGAIAAVLVLGCFAGEHAYREHQSVMAEQQFETALQVTDHALDHTREKLAKVGVQFGE